MTRVVVHFGSILTVGQLSETIQNCMKPVVLVNDLLSGSVKADSDLVNFYNCLNRGGNVLNAKNVMKIYSVFVYASNRCMNMRHWRLLY